jgi:Ca2+-binding EF-hand superfamily protein
LAATQAGLGQIWAADCHISCRLEQGLAQHLFLRSIYSVMGGGVGKSISRSQELQLHLSEYKQHYNSFHLSDEDICKFFHIFRKIDVNRQGFLTSHQILEYLQITPTNFLTRVFSLFDYSKTGEISLFHFVLACWGLCTLYQKDFILYLFELYDLDETGFLDIKLAQQIIEDIYGEQFYSSIDAHRSSYDPSTLRLTSPLL